MVVRHDNIGRDGHKCTCICCRSSLREIALRFTKPQTATLFHSAQRQRRGKAINYNVYTRLPSHPNWVPILMLIANVCVCNAFFDISKLFARITGRTSSEYFVLELFFLWFHLASRMYFSRYLLTHSPCISRPSPLKRSRCNPERSSKPPLTHV